MGTNIPRPTKRPATPARIRCDGIIGEKTKDEILEYLKTGLTMNDHRRILGLDPVEEVKPVPLIPRMSDRVPGVHRTNCPNCCAVITGPICEYCGTRFSERYMIHRSTEGEEFIIPLNPTGDQVEKTIDAFIEFQSVAHNFGLPIQKQR